MGLGFEVACDFKSMHIAAQSNDIQFCWVAGQISNNEYWAIDNIDVVTQPCDFPKFTISNTEMSPLETVGGTPRFVSLEMCRS